MVSTELRKNLYVHLDDLMSEVFLLGYSNPVNSSNINSTSYNNDIITYGQGSGMNITPGNATSHLQFNNFRQSYLRPLAYSTLVDFIYQMKEALQINQITRAVHMFCVVLHDPTLSMGIQVASLRCAFV